MKKESALYSEIQFSPKADTKLTNLLNLAFLAFQQGPDWMPLGVDSFCVAVFHCIGNFCKMSLLQKSEALML